MLLVLRGRKLASSGAVGRVVNSVDGNCAAVMSIGNCYPSSQVFIVGQEAIRNKAMEQALKQTNHSSMKTSMRTAKFAAEAAEVRGKVLNEKHEELARHMGKKPRGK